MRYLSRLNKRGISVIVAYVLLVSIAIALSSLVFTWLRFYASPEAGEKCPDGVSLIIKDYKCENLFLDITLENKGLFSVDRFILRINDRVGADAGIYGLKEGLVGLNLVPGNETNKRYSFSDFEVGRTLSDITFVEVQPVIENDEGDLVYCSRIASRVVDCS